MSGYGNYQTTLGGGNVAADGGGFLAGGTQAASQGGGKSYEVETLRPVLIKQILDSTQHSPDSRWFQIDGADVGQMTFVGYVRNITSQPTHLTYRIDDCTSIVEVKKWVDSRPDEDEMDMDGQAPPARNEQEKPIVVGSVVRVYGRLKSFNGKKHIAAHVIRLVEDYHELLHHYLEADYCHLWFSKGIGRDAGATSAGNMKEDNNLFVEPHGGAVGANTFEKKIASLPPNAKKVMQFLKAHSTPDGMHINFISQGTGLSLRDVAGAAEQCVSSGHIFTTIDEDTFAILDY